MLAVYVAGRTREAPGSRPSGWSRLLCCGLCLRAACCFSAWRIPRAVRSPKVSLAPLHHPGSRSGQPVQRLRACARRPSPCSRRSASTSPITGPKRCLRYRLRRSIRSSPSAAKKSARCSLVAHGACTGVCQTLPPWTAPTPTGLTRSARRATNYDDGSRSCLTRMHQTPSGHRSRVTMPHAGQFGAEWAPSPGHRRCSDQRRESRRPAAGGPCRYARWRSSRHRQARPRVSSPADEGSTRPGRAPTAAWCARLRIDRGAPGSLRR